MALLQSSWLKTVSIPPLYNDYDNDGADYDYNNGNKDNDNSDQSH